MNVGKSKVMRCSRNANVGRLNAILNGEPFEGIDYLKFLGSQVAADGGGEKVVILIMNEWYRAWGGGLKIVLSNRGLGINEKSSL